MTALRWLCLAQTSVPTDPPVTVAASLFLVLVLLLGGWLYTRSSYQELKEHADAETARADRLEAQLGTRAKYRGVPCPRCGGTGVIP